jgi:(1->4)-alpha-D-glucan 1-alpha-D-glucosylmutase
VDGAGEGTGGGRGTAAPQVALPPGAVRRTPAPAHPDRAVGRPGAADPARAGTVVAAEAPGPDPDDARDPVATADLLCSELRDALREGRLRSRRPASTYRIQLTRTFGFDHVAAIVPYLHQLGVTDVYLSPILEAAPGSTHGYDVVDHGRLSPELGGEEAYARLCDALARHGMGQLVDFVPNHMGVGPRNAWWMEVLENGPSSRYAYFFDVDWRPVKTELENKVLVPVLGDQYGVVLERGELKLAREGGSFFVLYWDHRFPVAPRSVPQVLRHRLENLRDALGPEEPSVWELESICASLDKLAPRSETDRAKVEERAREKEVAKRRLHALCDASAAAREHVDGNVSLFNGRPGDAPSFDLLDRLLDSQAYRLAHWRVAGEEINYRRFFDVNGLAAIRMEDARVFEEAHRLVLRYVREGKVIGLRIDHPDGLYDPTTYFRRLQASALAEHAEALAVARDEPLDGVTRAALRARLEGALAAGELPPRPLYVVAEKILSHGERMPEAWAIDGTTGYEFLAAASGLFVDGSAEESLTEGYARFIGTRRHYRDIAYATKRIITSSSMASEINMLAHRLNRISETNRRTRDFTLNELRRALVEFVANFPVYRTYVTPQGEVDERDRRYVETSVLRARRRSPVTDPSIYEFLRDVVLLRYPETLPERQRQEWLEFTLKLQQVTGPVTAKALEDTAYYVYHRLVSQNEVGGDPREFGTTVQAFHALNAARRERWPGSLASTSTHDTKRSEDVRVRIAALTEVSREWRALLARWGRTSRRFRTEVDGDAAPDRNDEILLYQTLVGSYPDPAPKAGGDAFQAYARRIVAYMQKAIREAKVHTSWTNVDEDYERAVTRFVEGVLGSAEFMESFAPFARRIAAAGRLSSLAQVALKLGSPGPCDVYQGCELWDLSLVDPDNRRPVDYERRAKLLDELRRRVAEGPSERAALAREVSQPEALPDGRAKLLLVREGLRLRRAAPELFLDGEYVSLSVEGPHADRVVAFARRHGRRAFVCVAPRLTLQLLDAGGGRIAWDGRVMLPQGMLRDLRDVVTGARRHGDRLLLEDLLSGFPVSLLATSADA